MAFWWVVTAAVAALSVWAEGSLHDAAHAPYWWHVLPGFDLAYGLLGCLAIIVLSKALGKMWLQRPADYYDSTDATGRDRP